jgi:hypothetical protein
MSLLTLLPAEAHEELAPLIMPPLAFAGIAAAFFVILAIVSWSWRDVAHRHNDKTSAASDSQSSHH